MTSLSREQILALFDGLNERLAARELTGELYLVGGAVLCLVHRARAATQDVDGFFEPRTLIRELAEQVSVEFDVEPDWLNDAVKGFLSPHGDFDEFLELSHLRVLTASPEYLLAMKAIAMRLGAEFHDENDVRFLLQYIGVRSYGEALAIVEKYYPVERIPQKTFYALQDLVDELLA